MTNPPIHPSGRRPRTHTSLLFLSLLLFVILAIAFLLPVQPNDYWWYVRIGREIAAQGGIPTVETLSYTQAGQPVVYQTWLAGLIFWGVDVLGGPALTILLRAVLIGGFYLFIWLALRESGAGPKLASLLTLLAALAASSNWAMRPQLFAYPLFGFSLWALVRWQKGKTKTIWLLPPLAALWVNLHGSFLLLFFLLAAALAAGAGDRRKLVLVTFVALAASFANPQGIFVWQQAFSLVQNPSSVQFSVEWHPPANQGWQMNLFFAWLLVFPVLAAFAPVKPARLHWLWFLGFGWMALSGLRYVIWFTAILAFLSAVLLSPWIGRKLDHPGSFSRPAPNLVLSLMLLLLPFLLLPGVREAWWQDAPPVLSENTPVEAARWLGAHPELPGPLFSELAFSSYLTAALPQRPVWIHTRFETFPPAQFTRYLEISGAVSDWQEQLDEEGINLLFLSRSEQPLLVEAAARSSRWHEVYHDETAVLFTRSPR
ncbi:MAG: hypothetical protein IT308_04235 [Anaerolineaceae bacterium]|nr:hypothetical protein [Anaerolineaceae bacterium]